MIHLHTQQTHESVYKHAVNVKNFTIFWDLMLCSRQNFSRLWRKPPPSHLVEIYRHSAAHSSTINVNF